MVRVPEVGGLLIRKAPVKVYWLLLQIVGFAVKLLTPQTKEQSAAPLPPVLLKVM